MEIKIGVLHTARELAVESTLTADEIEAAVASAVSGQSGVLTLTDEKGRKVIIPANHLAYIEIGEPTPRRVGFGTI